MMANRSQTQVSPLLIALMLVLAAALVAVATLPALRDIPFTNHAKDGHVDQAWNATIIQARISSRRCSPILAYACTRQTVVMCPVGPNLDDLWMGLIIGTANGEPAVVTGYAASRSYWMKRVAGCLPVSYVP